MIEKDKVAIYVISRKGLLVFAHSAHPEVGLQVPAGTIRAGELPVNAALRELEEETGLMADVSSLECLGVFEHDMRPFRQELQVRHAYLLRLTEHTQDRWAHWEEHPDTPGATPVEFQFHWEPLHDALPSLLAVGHGAPVRHLCKSAPQEPVRRLEYEKVQEAVRAASAKRRGDLARLIHGLEPLNADRLLASTSQAPLAALLEHVACTADIVTKGDTDPTPVYELLQETLAVPAELALLVVPRGLCLEVAEHKYETPLYLATAAAIKQARTTPMADWNSAVDLLSSLNCMATVENCLGVVVDLGTKKLLDPTNSYTLSGVPGTIYCEHVASRVRLAETLLHEATHTWLNYAFAALQPNGFSDRKYWSPWRHKERPAYGILQATFVFSLLCQFFDRCRADGSVGPVDKAYAESRLRVESQVLRDNEATLTQALEEVEDIALRAVIAEDLNRALNMRSFVKE